MLLGSEILDEDVDGPHDEHDGDDSENADNDRYDQSLGKTNSSKFSFSSRPELGVTPRVVQGSYSLFLTAYSPIP
jgi:hypothetical protein